jgi:hypothetical protein
MRLIRHDGGSRRGEYRTPSRALWFRRSRARRQPRHVAPVIQWPRPFVGHAKAHLLPGSIRRCAVASGAGSLRDRGLALDAVFTQATNLLTKHVRRPSSGGQRSRSLSREKPHSHRPWRLRDRPGCRTSARSTRHWRARPRSPTASRGEIPLCDVLDLSESG